MRLEPGTEIEPHRHTGEAHGYTISGQREILGTGELLGAGTYVYEAPGNEDNWMAVGDEPLVIFVTVRGEVETLDERGEVKRRANAATSYDSYHRQLAAR